MARVSTYQIEKEQKVKEAFQELYRKNMYTTRWILNEVGKRFFISPRTVEAIIGGEYEKRRQA